MIAQRLEAKVFFSGRESLSNLQRHLGVFLTNGWSETFLLKEVTATPFSSDLVLFLPHPPASLPSFPPTSSSKPEEA